jgi:hypothetical protein
MTSTRARCSAALRVSVRRATARPSCTEYPATEIVANAKFSVLVRDLREKFPARFALGISRLVASTTTPPYPAPMATVRRWCCDRSRVSIPIMRIRPAEQMTGGFAAGFEVEPLL